MPSSDAGFQAEPGPQITSQMNAELNLEGSSWWQQLEWSLDLVNWVFYSHN